MDTSKIDNWDEYLQKIGRIELLTRKEEAELATDIQNGDNEALTRLAHANLRFVVALAAQHVTDEEQRVNELKRLAIIGNKALEQAAKEYHTATDEPFIKFAVPYIRTAMENHKK